jgi:ribosomal-protein-alanine N-acetyltransferase
MEISFQNLSTADLDEVLEIEQLCFMTPWSKFAFIHEIQFEKSVFKTLRVSGRLVGYSGFWHLHDEIHISNIAVHPEYQRKGLGKTLLIHLLEEAVARKASTASLEVRRSNIAAQNLYGTFGFRVVTVKINYYSDEGEDALVMWNDNIAAALTSAGRGAHRG